MAVRATQLAVEILRDYVGSDESIARSTQVAVEILRDYGGSDESLARSTQLAIEIFRSGTDYEFETSGAMAAATDEVATLLVDPTSGMRMSQEVLETAQSINNEIRLSQESLELAEFPDNNVIQMSQEVLEFVNHPTQEVRMAQECLEVILYGSWTSSKKNHSFIKAYMATGKGSNASFSG